MNRFQRPTFAIIFVSLFISSFTIDSTPVKNFLNPDASKEKKDQEAAKNKPPLPKPQVTEAEPSANTAKSEKPNLEAKTTDKKEESDRPEEEGSPSTVKKKRKAKTRSNNQNIDKETKKTKVRNLLNRMKMPFLAFPDCRQKLTTMQVKKIRTAPDMGREFLSSVITIWLVMGIRWGDII